MGLVSHKVLLTKKEFAGLASLKTKDLSNYIKRGKVKLSNDLIDPFEITNREFLYRRSFQKGYEFRELDRKLHNEVLSQRVQALEEENLLLKLVIEFILKKKLK